MSDGQQQGAGGVRVLVAGACGRMGREVALAVRDAAGVDLVAAVDVRHVGRDIGEVVGEQPCGVAVSGDLAETINAARPQVMVDFTRPDTVMDNLRVALVKRVAAVVGTTGLTTAHLQELTALTAEHDTPVFIAPNFAIGAVLMMRFAAEAARHFDHAEVIEYHHEKKLDAPSGTALLTAELMRSAASERLATDSGPEAGEDSRGRPVGGVRVHAVRMPGFVASQDVIFGSIGETLTIRHDTINRNCFMPGVLLAIRKVRGLSGVTVGLQTLLWPE